MTIGTSARAFLIERPRLMRTDKQHELRKYRHKPLRINVQGSTSLIPIQIHPEPDPKLPPLPPPTPARNLTLADLANKNRRPERLTEGHLPFKRPKRPPVIIGEVYVVKKTGQLTSVKITGERRDGKPGWEGVNLKNGRKTKVQRVERKALGLSSGF